MYDFCPNCGRPNGGSRFCTYCGADFEQTPIMKTVNGVLISCNKNVGDEKIPKGVTAIGDEAFKGCGNLWRLVISDEVKSIGIGAFSDCGSLEIINIPDGVTSISARTFERCGLFRITIPNSVTSIGDRAFANCRFLMAITIPDSVTSIGEGAFCGCIVLKAVSVPRNCQIAEDAFPKDCQIDRR